MKQRESSDSALLRILTIACLQAMGAACSDLPESDFDASQAEAAENGSGATYQAESYSNQSGCTKSTLHAGYTGTGFVDYGGNGTWIEWNNINVPAAGNYLLTFRYAASSNRPCTASVNNGATRADVPFASTATWTSWRTTPAVSVRLNAGSNTIRVMASTSAGGPNLDSIALQSASTSPPPPPPPGTTCNSSNSAAVSYYHLRVEFSSSSNWAKVAIAKPEHVLRVGTPRITGGGSRVRADLDLIEVNQSGGTVTISADYAVKPDAIMGGLQNFFGRLTKGSSGQSRFSVRRIDGACSSLASCPEGVEIGRASAGPSVQQATIQFQLDQGQNVASKSAKVLPLPPMSWAVYYPWYRDRDPFASNTLQKSIADRGDLRNRVNSYWTNNKSFKDRPIGPSDMGGKGMLSYDSVALRTQVEQAVGAGIDGFLPYYRGTTHFTHGATGLLLDAVRDVNAAQGAGFRVGLHLSPQGARENAGSGDPVNLLAAWAADFVRVYGNHPAVMKIYSKPLAIVYSTGLFTPGDWKRFRERLAGNGIHLFLVADNASATDFREYIVHFDGAVGRSIDAAKGLAIGTQLRHNAIFTQEPPKLWLGEARPGFDSSDRGEPKDAKYEPRDNGANFHNRFNGAQAINPQWIRIVSWNEYYEHTHIEPSSAYGSQYLNIARDRVGRWKNVAAFPGACIP